MTVRPDHARCDVCALKKFWTRQKTDAWAPVCAEVPPTSTTLIVGAAPGNEEVSASRPFVSRNALEATAHLESAGFSRGKVSYTYTVACRYPGTGDAKAIKKFEAAVARRKDPKYQSPKLCCAPRLEAEVAAHRFLLLCGSLPAKAVLPGNPKLQDIRGGPWPAPETDVPLSLRGKKVLVVDDYNTVSRDPALQPLFAMWAKKAARWFYGEIDWQDPSYIVNPPIDYLERRLLEWESGKGLPPSPGHLLAGLPELDTVSRSEGFLGERSSRTVEAEDIPAWVIYDVETDGVDPETANLRCCVFYDGRDRLPNGEPATFILAWRSIADHPMREELAALRVARTSRKAEVFLQAADKIYAAALEENTVLAENLRRLTQKYSGAPRDAQADIADDIRTAVLALGGIRDVPITMMEPDYAAAVDDWMVRFLQAPYVVKAGWNNRTYDRVVMRQAFGVDPEPEVDFVLWHRLCWPNFRHSLWFAGSTLTDVFPWKAEKAAVNAPSDEVLHKYNSRDGAVTYKAGLPLQGRAAAGGHTLWHYGLLEELQDVARGIHRLGMYVDEERRQEHENTQEARKAAALKVVREFEPGLNPRSTKQLGDLLYKRHALPPSIFTETGAPSTSDEAIRDLYSSPLTPKEILPLLRAIRDYKASEKLLNTFIRKFRRGSWHPKKGQWIVDPSGLARPEYLVFGTAGWRWSSAGAFNSQNIPEFLRDMFVPPEGSVFVYADFDQLELRLSAALAGASYYLDAFEQDHIDVHNLSAQMIFGDAYWTLPGAPKDKRKKGEKGSKFSDRRDLVKRVVYLGIYGGEADALKTVLSEIEQRIPRKHADGTPIVDDTGRPLYDLKFPYARMPREKISDILQSWRDAAPEYQSWWADSVQRYRKHGYIEEPIWGLRRPFYSEEFNKIVNIQVQSGGCALAHNAMLLLKRGPIPFDFERKQGIVAQTHDALVVQVSEDRAEEAREYVEGYMTQRYPHLNVTFSTEAKVQKHW